MVLGFLTRHKRKKKLSQEVTASSKKPKHSKLGKAIIEALNDVKEGNYTIIKQENAERDTGELFE